MNMLLHDVENPQIAYRDSLSKLNTDRENYTLVLANPPFKGSLDEESVGEDLLRISQTGKTEVLFLALTLRVLKNGGRCAIIVPEGLLSIRNNAQLNIRKELIEKNHVSAIISLPSGVFKPYAGVKTSIVIFNKTGIGGTNKVWFYDMKADGYSLDDKREEIDDNDIDEIIQRYNNISNEETRKRVEKSFFISKEEIVKNNYILSIEEYKEISKSMVNLTEETEGMIINKIFKRNQEIDILLNKLKELK